MKTLLIITTVLFFNCVFAQVGIGKSSISNPSVSLEFADYDNLEGKGIIIPWTNASSTLSSVEKGTLIFDTSDKIVKYKKADGSWFNLSRNEITTVNSINNYDTTGLVNTTLQDLLSDKQSAKVSIGNLSPTPGILVLEDTNKAMILPKVPNPHLNIVNPEPGTMAYDTITKQLAIFNGNVWSFWKP